MRKSTSVLSSLVATAGLLAVPVIAGTAPPPPPPVTPDPPPPFVTGSLSFTVDTHFVSYGQDVWGSGSNWDEALFHPALDLNFNLGSGFGAYINTWWDINDLVPSPIGGNIQEIDVNAGFTYTLDKWAFQIGYGAWIYGEQVEHIIDGKISYNDGLINPFLMLHGRVDDGIPFDTGLVTQVGIVPGTSLGPVSLSFPITVSFDTDNFHGGDSGFAYASAGIAASIPIVDHVSLALGLTYYYTNDDVIPVNPDDSFLTGSAGVVISF